MCQGAVDVNLFIKHVQFLNFCGLKTAIIANLCKTKYLLLKYRESIWKHWANIVNIYSHNSHKKSDFVDFLSMFAVQLL